MSPGVLPHSYAMGENKNKTQTSFKIMSKAQVCSMVHDYTLRLISSLDLRQIPGVNKVMVFALPHSET